MAASRPARAFDPIAGRSRRPNRPPGSFSSGLPVSVLNVPVRSWCSWRCRASACRSRRSMSADAAPAPVRRRPRETLSSWRGLPWRTRSPAAGRRTTPCWFAGISAPSPRRPRTPSTACTSAYGRDATFRPLQSPLPFFARRCAKAGSRRTARPPAPGPGAPVRRRFRFPQRSIPAPAPQRGQA